MLKYKSLFDYMYTTLGFSPGGEFRDDTMYCKNITDDQLTVLRNGVPYLVVNNQGKTVEFTCNFERL